MDLGAILMLAGAPLLVGSLAGLAIGAVLTLLLAAHARRAGGLRRVPSEGALPAPPQVW
jgi:hypothetical protein